MISSNLDNIEVCRWAVRPGQWQEIWSISCRVWPSYSISTTANNHQLRSAPDHLSLGNKEGDNSQWEAFYLKSLASPGISSLRLPAAFLDTSRLFRRKDGHFALTDWLTVLGFLLFAWFTVTRQCDRPGLCFHPSSSLSCSAPDRKSEKPSRGTWAVISSVGGSY